MITTSFTVSLYLLYVFVSGRITSTGTEQPTIVKWNLTLLTVLMLQLLVGLVDMLVSNLYLLFFSMLTVIYLAVIGQKIELELLVSNYYSRIVLFVGLVLFIGLMVLVLIVRLLFLVPLYFMMFPLFMLVVLYQFSAKFPERFEFRMRFGIGLFLVLVLLFDVIYQTTVGDKFSPTKLIDKGESGIYAFLLSMILNGIMVMGLNHYRLNPTYEVSKNIVFLTTMMVLFNTVGDIITAVLLSNYSLMRDFTVSLYLGYSFLVVGYVVDYVTVVGEGEEQPLIEKKASIVVNTAEKKDVVVPMMEVL